MIPSVLRSLVAAERVTDTANERVVTGLVIGLVLVGVLVILATVWFWRSTRPDHEALLGLELLARSAPLDAAGDAEVVDAENGDAHGEDAPRSGASAEAMPSGFGSDAEPADIGGPEGAAASRRRSSAWVDALRHQVRAVTPPRPFDDPANTPPPLGTEQIGAKPASPGGIDPLLGSPNRYGDESE